MPEGCVCMFTKEGNFFMRAGTDEKCISSLFCFKFAPRQLSGRITAIAGALEHLKGSSPVF
jgi:hypothetical protein